MADIPLSALLLALLALLIPFRCSPAESDDGKPLPMATLPRRQPRRQATAPARAKLLAILSTMPCSTQPPLTLTGYICPASRNGRSNRHAASPFWWCPKSPRSFCNADRLAPLLGYPHAAVYVYVAYQSSGSSNLFVPPSSPPSWPVTRGMHAESPAVSSFCAWSGSPISPPKRRPSGSLFGNNITGRISLAPVRHQILDPRP